MTCRKTAGWDVRRGAGQGGAVSAGGAAVGQAQAQEQRPGTGTGKGRPGRQLSAMAAARVCCLRPLLCLPGWWLIFAKLHRVLPRLRAVNSERRWTAGAGRGGRGQGRGGQGRGGWVGGMGNRGAQGAACCCAKPPSPPLL
jgi:hypothetical protein